MRRFALFLLLFAGTIAANAQDYTSYRTGAATDTAVQPQGGVCLMGGGAEVDPAMKWFLKRASGGDVLVLRTSGADGYNSYMFSGLGVPLHSVETIVCHNANASQSAYLKQRLAEAEAIWFAGGDQLVYINYWRGTAVDSIINSRLQNGNLAIGGTSAGMAILGSRYFSAQNGTVTSADALANPFISTLTVDTAAFLKIKYLEPTLTDTHFDNPDRKGRAVVFLARNNFNAGFLKLSNLIALDEETALTIEPNGMSHVWGDSATGAKNAYFIRPNCNNIRPETLLAGTPLTWKVGGKALKVYHIKGNPTGNNSFNLDLDHVPIPLANRSWVTPLDATGGVWEDWSVEAGALTETGGAQPPACVTGAVKEVSQIAGLQVSPNPAGNFVQVTAPAGGLQSGQLLSATGRSLGAGILETGSLRFDMQGLPAGLYVIRVICEGEAGYARVVKE